MRAAFYIAALAAITGGADGAKDELTHAVLRFTNKSLVKVREDPIANPGTVGKHVHNVMGGSAFSKTVTGEELMNSKCTNAQIVGDMSSYWFPSLYFHDPDSGEFEDVEISYVNVYYFFEPTDDDLEPFPTGLKILGGDPYTRTPPKGGAATNLDPSKGPIQNVKFTCPRLNNNYSPASWPADSDGTMAGMQDPINEGEGAGFPDVTCDGVYSPLRADIHMPSCYNPDKGLDDHKNNMAWPSTNGNGKINCPKGHVHVPHLFFEIYWDTPKFQGRWTEGKGEQPFVLSNGDATGYSSHADFMAAWDEDTLRHIIDTCDATDQGNGMDQCPGLEINTEDCSIEPDMDEKTTGLMSLLPGDNPLLGWKFGLDGVKNLIPDVGAVLPGPSDDSSPKPTSKPASGSGDGLPVLEDPATNVVENPIKPEATSAAAESPDAVEPSPEVPAPKPVAAEPVAEEPVEEPKPESTSCSKNVHTVWETVTETENVYAEPTANVEAARRHLHGHRRGHGRSFH